MYCLVLHSARDDSDIESAEGSAHSTKSPTTPDVGQQGFSTGQAASGAGSKRRAERKRKNKEAAHAPLTERLTFEAEMLGFACRRYRSIETRERSSAHSAATRRREIKYPISTFR